MGETAETQLKSRESAHHLGLTNDRRFCSEQLSLSFFTLVEIAISTERNFLQKYPVRVWPKNRWSGYP